jgi:hypothetical protein
MPYQPIIYQRSKIKLHKANINPNFNSKTILVNNHWDYVQMWLKRQRNCEEALFYWEQAKYFFDASISLPKVSSPLTAYYCFLNATKCLLSVKKEDISDKRLQHGVSGESINKRISLSNEKIVFQNSGVLFLICQYLNENVNKDEYTIYYN